MSVLNRILAIGKDVKAVGRKHLNEIRWQRALRNGQNGMDVDTLFGPMSIRIGAEDAIGHSLLFNGEFEMDLIKRTMSFLRQIGRCPPAGQGTLLDIGANIGVISIEMLKTGEVSNAVMVEPEPTNDAMLEENVRKNGLQSRVYSQRLAVGDAESRLVFEVSGLNSGDHRVRVSAHPSAQEAYRESDRKTIEVQSTTLDALVELVPTEFKKQWAVLWVDVQGFEQHVYGGARRLLSTGIPVVSELWPYGLERAGNSITSFCSLASELWTHYYVFRRDRYVEYPIETLASFFAELAGPFAYDNIIFLKK
jgi:FkbM family methyltransferase